MRFRFDRDRPIILPVEILGPNGALLLHLLLDTGAATTMINTRPLHRIGIETNPNETRTITTASDVEPMPTARVSSVRVGDIVREDLVVLAHDLPALAQLDGLLGMDFLAGLHVSIRMKHGILTLEEDSDAL